MMKFYNYISLFAAAFLFGLLAFSCSDESPVVGTFGSQDVKFQVKISDGVSVHTGSRAGGEEENSIFDRFPVGFDFREGRSLINVCSVDRSPGSKNYEPDYNYAYTIDEKDSHPTRYHQYICQTRREYEEYSDFVSYEDAVPLQWDKVNEETGERIDGTGNILRTNDGGFYLFAAMYPYTYKRPLKSGENVLSVNSDQTYDKAIGEDNGHFAAKLLVNDIRLCQKMYGYDHFRLPIQLDFFHSLCMLVVNVKIPLYKETDGLGFYKTDVLNINNPPTMSINSVGLHYKPHYEIAYDKNDAVSVSVVLDDDKAGLENIRMFHTPNFSKPDKTDPSNFKIEDYYYETTEEYEGEEVPVLWMQYCAILPFQQLTDANTDVNILFTIAGKKYRCHFSKISEPVKLEQGHVTIVSMYIPRGESDPILIGARLKDWERKRTPIVSLQ